MDFKSTLYPSSNIRAVIEGDPKILVIDLILFFMVPPDGIEPTIDDYKSTGIPFT